MDRESNIISNAWRKTTSRKAWSPAKHGDARGSTSAEPAQIQEDLRDVHRSRWLADLRMDLVYAARTLRRSPGFLASATLTLALGIGANTAIFSLIDAVMLQPLPVPNPSGLVQIARFTDSGDARVVSYPLFEYFRDRLTSISGSFAELPTVNTITLDGVDETDLWRHGVGRILFRVGTVAGGRTSAWPRRRCRGVAGGGDLVCLLEAAVRALSGGDR